jgi:uncharacterized membrane protein YcaP (DUF421 family)
MSAAWFWSGWEGPARVLVMGILSYAFLILILRATGKRTLSKMNAFDFIITVASGSTFAAVLLNDRISLAEGATAFVVLVVMQYGVAWASARSGRVERIVKSRPTILLWQGEMLRDVMLASRVTEAEVLAACREAGVASLRDVRAVVLETAGQFSVVRSESAPVPPGADTLRTADRTPGG